MLHGAVTARLLSQSGMPLPHSSRVKSSSVKLMQLNSRELHSSLECRAIQPSSTLSMELRARQVPSLMSMGVTSSQSLHLPMTCSTRQTSSLSCTRFSSRKLMRRIARAPSSASSPLCQTFTTAMQQRGMATWTLSSKWPRISASNHSSSSGSRMATNWTWRGS